MIAIGMSVPKNNDTYSAIMTLLEESIKSETAVAIGPLESSEKRHWQCGRADALAAFKEVILSVRNEALIQRGIKEDA